MDLEEDKNTEWGNRSRCVPQGKCCLQVGSEMQQCWLGSFVVSELHCLFCSAYLDLTGKGASHWSLTEHCAGLSMWRWMSVLKELRNSQVSSAKEHLQPESLVALEEPAVGAVVGEILGLNTAPQSHHKGQEETGTQLLPPESVSPAGNYGLNWSPDCAQSVQLELKQMWGKFWDAEQVWSAAGQGSTEGAAVAGKVAQGNASSPRGTIVLGKEKDPLVNTTSQDSWALLSLSLRILFCLTVWGGCQNRGFCVKQAGERAFILGKKELLCLIRKGWGPREPQHSRRMLWPAQGAGTRWGSAL